MCFGGGRPQAPQVVYQGPSKAEQQAQAQMLDQARRQMEQQGAMFNSQLDQQVAAANAETAKRMADLEAQTNAATAEAAAQQNGAYAATVMETPPPADALTTEETKAKEKTASGLKIAPAATVMGVGSGLNIGI